MPGLKTNTQENNEAGFLSVLLAILIASGFIVTLLALVIDGGQVQLMRTKVQSAADSVALAVAKNCAAATDLCSSTLDGAGALQAIADSESPNNPNYITEICGSAAATALRSKLKSCQALELKNPNDCSAVAGNTQFSKYVRVHVSSVSNSGQNSAFFPYFASLFGSADWTNRFTACGQYAIGTAAAIVTDPKLLPYPALKLAIAKCDAAQMSIQSVIKDSTASSCSFIDQDGKSFKSSAYGFFRFGSVGANCPGASRLAIGDKLCVTAPSNFKDDAAFKNELLDDIAKQRVYTVPVIESPVASGSQNLAAIAGFVNLRLNAVRTPAKLGQLASKVQYLPASSETSIDWAFCASTAQYCLVASGQKAIYTSIVSGVSATSQATSQSSAPNFGLETLTPLP